MRGAACLKQRCWRQLQLFVPIVSIRLPPFLKDSDFSAPGCLPGSEFRYYSIRFGYLPERPESGVLSGSQIMYSRAMPEYPAQHTDAAETLLAERADGADRGLRNAPYARGEPRLESVDQLTRRCVYTLLAAIPA